MTRVTSLVVLAVLLGAAGVRLACAWSCQPSPVTAAATHCHETPAAALEFTASAPCNDVREGGALLSAAVKPDAISFVPFERATVFSLTADDGPRLRPAATHWNNASSPPAFAIPLRQ